MTPCPCYNSALESKVTLWSSTGFWFRISFTSCLIFLIAKARRWGSDGKVLDRGVTWEVHNKNAQDEDTNIHYYDMTRYKAGTVSEAILLYLWSGAAAFLETCLPSQTAPLGRGVVVQTKGGPWHDGCLETANYSETVNHSIQAENLVDPSKPGGWSAAFTPAVPVTPGHEYIPPDLPASYLDFRTVVVHMYYWSSF